MVEPSLKTDGAIAGALLCISVDQLCERHKVSIDQRPRSPISLDISPHYVCIYIRILVDQLITTMSGRDQKRKRGACELCVKNKKTT